MLTKEQIGASVVPVLLRGCKDQVANVRFCVAKLFRQIMPKLDPATVASKVKPALAEMTADSDKDVQYYAKQALAKC
ncbi:MAG: hypothetical protein P4L10_13405 [Acidobacteriaceae bacterium]|nr:hypothetical protein [Acidobacteriaceae bacterium]